MLFPMFGKERNAHKFEHTLCELSCQPTSGGGLAKSSFFSQAERGCKRRVVAAVSLSALKAVSSPRVSSSWLAAVVRMKHTRTSYRAAPHALAS